MSLEKNISRLLSRKDEIEDRLVSSSLSPSELMNLSKELAEIRPVVEQAVKLQKLKTELDDLLTLLKDPEADLDMKSLAEEEIKEIRPKIIEEEHMLKLLLLPKDIDDSRNAILDIRAGTGGLEASLFCSDLFRMYEKVCSKKKWELEIYNKGKQLNYYPFDNVVSDVSSVFKNLDVSNLYIATKTNGSGLEHLK